MFFFHLVSSVCKSQIYWTGRLFFIIFTFLLMGRHGGAYGGIIQQGKSTAGMHLNIKHLVIQIPYIYQHTSCAHTLNRYVRYRDNSTLDDNKCLCDAEKKTGIIKLNEKPAQNTRLQRVVKYIIQEHTHTHTNTRIYGR